MHDEGLAKINQGNKKKWSIIKIQDDKVSQIYYCFKMNEINYWIIEVGCLDIGWYT